jgi:hypothetical protein
VRGPRRTGSPQRARKIWREFLQMPERTVVAVSLVRPAVMETQQAAGPRSRSGWAGYAVVIACYVVGALIVTGRLWLDPASRVQVGDTRDVDQFIWFVRYSATAVSHFHLPALVTMAMDPPHGVNLMWNTSILLPGVVLAPVTLLAGPQVSLTLLLTASFALSSASLFLVLRRWGVSFSAAAIGGAVYGFSPALINSGQGHYHIVFMAFPPLIIDALLRIITGRARQPWLTGLGLGVLVTAQLFTGEEMLIDTAIVAVVLGVVLAASRPRQVPRRARAALTGLGAGAVTALVLCARGLWVQFHGTALGGVGAVPIISYHGQLTHLYNLPYAFVTPSSALLFHTSASAAAAQAYPQPEAEYLAYLGVPLILVLIVAAIYFWRRLPVRVTALSLAILELFSLGGQPINAHGIHYPAALLPWYWLQDLPGISSALPDRLSIFCDGLAGAALAFSLDLARARLQARRGAAGAQAAASTGALSTGAPSTGALSSAGAAASADDEAAADGGLSPAGEAPGPARPSPRRPVTTSSWLNGRWAIVVAVAAVLPLVPLPLHVSGFSHVPRGWRATFAQLRLPPDARVLVVPIPWGGAPQPLRWQGTSGEPASFIGGAFIQPGAPGRQSRAGRAGQTVTATYLYDLWQNIPGPAPTSAKLHTDLTRWDPAGVMAVTGTTTRLGKYLIKVFGQPDTQIGRVLGWRLSGPGQ